MPLQADCPQDTCVLKEEPAPMKRSRPASGSQPNGFRRSPRTPTTAQEWFAAGVQSHQAGHFARAEEHYRKAIAITAQHLDARIHLGLVLQATGRNSAAVEMYEAVLAVKPDHTDARLKLGNCLASQGKFVEAGIHYETALKVEPTNAGAHTNLGNVLAALNRLSDAAICYERALAADRNWADAYLNYGNLLQKQGKRSEASSMYEGALAINPRFAVAHMNLGHLLESAGRFPEAVASYTKALKIQPNYPAALMNLGNAYLAQGKVHEAIDQHRRALALRPDYPEAHMNLGGALQSAGKLEEAVASHDKALALRADYALAHLNRGVALLLAGNYAAGWPEHEWRWRTISFTSSHRNFVQPQWIGEPLLGKRILLHSEQGLGDCIQFLRYVPMVHAAGGRVVLEVPPSLRGLAAQLPGVEVLLTFGEPLQAFDLHCPLMSLPLAFRTEVPTIPNNVPYLLVPAEAQEKAKSFPWPSQGLRVGLVWAGNRLHKRDRFRSLPEEALRPLLSVSSVHFFSLQLGEQDATSRMGITSLPLNANMTDTAAYVAELDLVIAVDTSIAHLTGALGKPIWVLLSTETDWRWLTGREDSPWYPTARLFRQRQLNDWGHVIQNVSSSLSTLAATASSR